MWSKTESNTRNKLWEESLIEYTPEKYQRILDNCKIHLLDQSVEETLENSGKEKYMVTILILKLLELSQVTNY